MVTTLTLNPCIDKSIYIDQLQYGELNRVLKTREEIGGKGLNVSKVLKNLGIKTLCIGFNYESNGYLLDNELGSYGIDSELVMIDGKLRTNIKLYDSKNIMTELNESGGLVGSDKVDLLYQSFNSAMTKTDILVLSGSAPPGIDCDIYANMISCAKAMGVTTVLDADKSLFTKALDAHPDIIKPNLYELESNFGVSLKTTKEIADFARKIIEDGVKIVCVSLGSEGSIIVNDCKALYAPAPKLDPKGLTGAGDSMVAGICYALLKNMNTEDILRSAMAAASGSVEKPGLDLCEVADFEKYFSRVEIIKIF